VRRCPGWRRRAAGGPGRGRLAVARLPAAPWRIRSSNVVNRRPNASSSAPECWPRLTTYINSRRSASSVAKRRCRCRCGGTHQVSPSACISSAATATRRHCGHLARRRSFGDAFRVCGVVGESVFHAKGKPRVAEVSRCTRTGSSVEVTDPHPPGDGHKGGQHVCAGDPGPCVRRRAGPRAA
jgi:hypothetical protein